MAGGKGRARSHSHGRLRGVGHAHRGARHIPPGHSCQGREGRYLPARRVDERRPGDAGTHAAGASVGGLQKQHRSAGVPHHALSL